MNYEQLRALSWRDLLAHLALQVEHARSHPPDDRIMRDNLAGITAPTVFYLVDFEIRARFYTPEQPEVHVGDPPGTCQGLSSGVSSIKNMSGIFKP